MMIEACNMFCKYFPLLTELVKRDFKLKYKRSVLGILWSVLHPLIIMIVLNIVFSSLFRYNISNFPMYLICGHVIFNFFNESTTAALSSIIGNSPIIKSINVPSYIFPLSKTVSSLINMLFSLFALLIVLLATGVRPEASILLLPLPIIYTFAFSCGVCLLLSAGMVFFRDLAHLYGIAATILMYLTPIFYPESIIPQQYLPIFRLNPIAHFIRMLRDVVLYGTAPSLSDNLICAGFCLFSLILGTTFFCKSQQKFILHL